MNPLVGWVMSFSPFLQRNLAARQTYKTVYQHFFSRFECCFFYGFRVIHSDQLVEFLWRTWVCRSKNSSQQARFFGMDGNSGDGHFHILFLGVKATLKKLLFLCCKSSSILEGLKPTLWFSEKIWQDLQWTRFFTTHLHTEHHTCLSNKAMYFHIEQSKYLFFLGS